MADPEQYGETVDPRNPPNSVLRHEVRKATFWAYLGPLIVIVVILGIALLYWSTRDNTSDNRTEPAIGTSGENPGQEGSNPDRTPDSTKDETDYRGGNR
jgi:hypothetical protein